MAITANVIPSDDNSIELALQAFQLGGALTQAAAQRAWDTSNQAAADKGLTLAEFAATPEGGDFMRRRFGGILGMIPRGRDPVTGQPKTWAFLTDKLVNSLATPATMSAEKAEGFAQNQWTSGKVIRGEDGRYKPANDLSTQENYYAQQAADILNRYEPPSEQAKAAPKEPLPQGQAVSFSGEAKPAAAGQAVTPEAKPAAAPQGTLEQPNVLEWAAKTMIRPSKPAQYGGEDAGTRGKDTFDSFDVLDAKGNVIAQNQTMDSAKMLLQRRLDATVNQTPTKADYDAQREVMDAASANLKAAGYTQDKSLLWQPPSVASRPEAARIAQWSDAQLYGMLASPGVSKPQRQLIQELLDERRKTGQRPQISPESPTAQAQPQAPAQAAQAAPQTGQKSPAMASPGGQGAVETAPAGKPAQTFRQWLIANPSISQSMDFTRDPTMADTPSLLSGAPNAYRRYQAEMQGNGQTAQTGKNGDIGQNATYGQTRKDWETRSAEAMSEIRRAVPGHRKELDNPILAKRLLPWEAQKYLTGETARKAAEAMPEVEKLKANAEIWKAKADMFKETSANGRAMLTEFRQRLSPWDDQMAQVAKMMATEPKKAKDALDRIIVDMNQNPQVRGLVDGFNTTAAWLSDGNLLSVPTIFTAEQKKLFYAWSAASVGTSLQPRAMAGAEAAPQASVPGANQSAADAYEAGLRE